MSLFGQKTPFLIINANYPPLFYYSITMCFHRCDYKLAAEESQDKSTFFRCKYQCQRIC